MGLARTFLRLAALVLAASAPLAAAPAAAQAQRDWTRTIVATPEGGYRMGNPAAHVRVVEFVSLTCPHCRSFAQLGVPELLARHVWSGRVSFEIRNFVLNSIDEAAAVLNRCAPTAAAYWALNEAILAEQPNWVAPVTRLSEDQFAAIEALPDRRRLLHIAALTGLDALAARHGIGAARARACLTDPARLARVRSMRDAAVALGVRGTPSFLVNGRLAQDVYDWAGLEPLLAARR